MQLDRDEYMLLSRGGRVPRSSRAGPPEPYLVLEATRNRAGRPARKRGRVATRLLSAISESAGRVSESRPDQHRNR
jgi:hypothetical protein